MEKNYHTKSRKEVKNYMADDQGRGWHGDPQGHAKAGSQSSGNQGNTQQHSDAGKKGGKAAHPQGRGLQNADEETRERVAREGGQSRSDDDL